MRKSIFLTLVLSLCMADFGAFAANNQRGVRGSANTQSATTSAPAQAVSARAGTRQKVVNNGTTSASTGNVSARAGKKQTVVNTGTKTSGQPMAARAGATQKVINTGTKVATAAENTSVPEECQDAFYGCMDAFCMLDNASGGRCQCNDRITELDAVLDEIVKLDEQSYIMATEGVERIQMGEAEEEIMKRAKAAGEKAVAGENSAENKKKARTLDLSVFNNNIFNDLDDDAFETDAQQSILNKKGNALYSEAVKMCGAQVPAQCKSYGSMLSLVYGQKIKSDCIAYENSLKAQKNQSQQKLQTAQKALRDAALDEYKNQNKYATTGECVIAFTECMKTTAECGDDYTGCVTLAAAENMKNTKAGSTKAKQTRIKGQVSGADITLAASTMESLLAKKVICERITKQCVNSNKNDAVWNGFLRNAAPALKSAELIAEQNLRSNCIPSAAKCFSDACKSQFGENDESYDMCLSNPLTYKNLCKVQLEPCLEATGGSFSNPEKSSMWNGLVAMLGAMKVDACTKEVKDCLLSEDRCGKDYAGCIGLDTATIGSLCPYEKLTACMTDKTYKDETEVYKYVAQIAQGLALQIDNSLATVCQNAASEAMIKVCGDTESCDAATFDLSALESSMGVQVCQTKFGSACYDNLAMFKDDELKSKGVYAVIKGLIDISAIKGYTEEEPNGDASSGDTSSGDASGGDASGEKTARQVLQLGKKNISLANQKLSAFRVGNVESKYDKKNTEQAQKILDSALNNIMAQINADPKVTYCREGRTIQGFDSNTFGQGATARFPNLTDSYQSIIANSLLSQLSEQNAKLTSKFTQQLADLNNEISERIYATNESELDEKNNAFCLHNYHVPDKSRCQQVTYDENGNVQNKKGKGEDCEDDQPAGSGTKELTDKIATYDAETNICSVKTMKFKCKDWRVIVFGSNYCAAFDNGTVINTESIQMTKSR